MSLREGEEAFRKEEKLQGKKRENFKLPLSLQLSWSHTDEITPISKMLPSLPHRRRYFRYSYSFSRSIWDLVSLYGDCLRQSLKKARARKPKGMHVISVFPLSSPSLDMAFFSLFLRSDQYLSGIRRCLASSCLHLDTWNSWYFLGNWLWLLSCNSLNILFLLPLATATGLWWTKCLMFLNLTGLWQV